MLLFRFCLYGFLKNQRYFEPFLILALRQKGLSFAAIGALIAVRAASVNLLEVPSGALADALGRRRAMLLAFAAYIAAFLGLAEAGRLGSLAVAMALFGVGEAFRSGTHKAMVFDWLAREGRTADSAMVYGLTRAWSKLGEAVSVVIAAVAVFLMRDYRGIFLLSIPPCVVNVLNVATYPRELDGPATGGVTQAGQTFIAALRLSLRRGPLRRLLGESMAYDGLFSVGKDYLQPVLKGAALGLPVLLMLEDRQRVAVVVGAVYGTLHLLSSAASRQAGRFAARVGGDAPARRCLWLLNLLTFAGLGFSIVMDWTPITISAFLVLAALQNLWRPVLVGCVAQLAPRSQTATVLSVESQAKSLFVALIAPGLGWLVDASGRIWPEWAFLPVAVLGMIVPLPFIARRQAGAPGRRSGAEAV